MFHGVVSKLTFLALLVSLNWSEHPQATAYKVRKERKHDWVRRPEPVFDFPRFQPKLQIGKCPELRVAVVNGVNFHFEVLAGLLWMLKPYGRHVDAFVSKFIQNPNFNGALDMMRWFGGEWRKTEEPKHVDSYDVVVLISPDYELDQNIALVKRMQPKLLVAFVHNAGFANISQLFPLAPAVKLFTLSPHVAASHASTINREVDWMLPVYPMHIEENCWTFPKRWVMGMCLRGFAMQGKFSNLRRNYTAVWAQMTDKLDIIKDPQVSKVLHVNVLGKGADRLGLPATLEQHVTVHRKLQYNAFFETIARTVALLPCLAGDRYYKDKFSSTIIASLISGTPILANSQLLQAYSFLTPDAVFQQLSSEDETDAMVRISGMSADDVFKVREGVLRLRAELNVQASAKIEALISSVCGSAASTSTAAQA